MSMTQRLDELKKKGEQAKLGGGPEKIGSQHSRGKMTARERIDALVDPGSFVEIDRFVVHQTSDFGRWSGYGTRQNRWTTRLPLLPRLHHVRRLVRGNVRPKGHQNNGHGAKDRSPSGRTERLGGR